MENKITKFIKEFFYTNEFEMFHMDEKSLVIRINGEIANNKANHTLLFSELQKITAMLDLMEIDYSVDVDGSIILH